ncbi:MAG: DMT family transporter, partial [Alphaproteobacteria bacterium]|nr:DMT family transporter [Alphaproteobacteria bacterium]
MLPYAALIATALIWSGNWVAGRWLQGTISPVTLTFWRLVIAAAVLAPFTILPLWRERAVLRREWPRLLVFAVIGLAGFNTLVYFGLRTTTAINGSLVNSASPIFVIVISWFGLGDRSTWRQGIGVAISLLGVAAILSRGDPEALLALRFGLGDLVILGAVFMWALYSTLLRHWPSALKSFTFVAATIGLSIVVLIPAYLVERAYVGDFDLTWNVALGIAYMAVLASITGYACWNFGARAVGAGKASLFLHLIPAFA